MYSKSEVSDRGLYLYIYAQVAVHTWRPNMNLWGNLVESVLSYTYRSCSNLISVLGLTQKLPFTS